MNVRLVVKDNQSGRSVTLLGRLSEQDLDFLNGLGERIAQGTDWEIALVAVEDGS